MLFLSLLMSLNLLFCQSSEALPAFRSDEQKSVRLPEPCAQSVFGGELPKITTKIHFSGGFFTIPVPQLRF
jgi:hypothetical protein